MRHCRGSRIKVHRVKVKNKVAESATFLVWLGTQEMSETTPHNKQATTKPKTIESMFTI